MVYNEKLIELLEDFLKKDKDCFSEFIGHDLSLGERKKVEFYGVSKDGDEKTVHLITGSLKSVDKNEFFKFYEKSKSYKTLADYVYAIDIYDDSFEEINKFEIDLCKKEGIGILLLGNDNIIEFLKPYKNNISDLKKKEMLYRIFLNDLEKPIASLIFQSFYEYIKLRPGEQKCSHFIEVYNSLFSSEDYITVLKKILPKRELSAEGMRKGFGSYFKDDEYVQIQKNNVPIWHYICMTDEGMQLGKEPILLD